MANLPNSLHLPLLLPGEEEETRASEVGGPQPAPPFSFERPGDDTWLSPPPHSGRGRVPITNYTQKRRTCLCGEAPVVLDTLFEETQSRALAGTVLAFACFHFLLFLLYRTGQAAPSCPAVPALHLSKHTEARLPLLHSPPSFTHARVLARLLHSPPFTHSRTPQVAQRVLSYAAVTACGLAVHRGNAGDWLLTSRLLYQAAWLCLLTWTALFVLQDLAPCLQWLFSDGRIANVEAVVASALSLVDAALLLALLCFLGDATRARVTQQHVDVRSVTPASSPFHRRSSVARTGDGLLAHWWRLLQVAPLRHTVSVVVSLTVFTMLTVVLCVAAVLLRRKLDKQLGSAIRNWDDWVQQLENIVSNSTSSVPPPPPLWLQQPIWP